LFQKVPGLFLKGFEGGYAFIHRIVAYFHFLHLSWA
jgi:hypothetical protein